VLRVIDDGSGIAPAELAVVFDLFTQADDTLLRRDGGLGIGLSLVRKIVELHGGSVRCDSRGLGFGATFEIRLPLLRVADVDVTRDAARPPDVRPLAREGSTSGDAPGRVLLIDDNVDGTEAMASLLRLRGYQVWTAFDGGAGLETAMAIRPAIMLVDIGLPTIDGYEVARRVRAEPSLRDVRLIALTGWGSARDQDLALRSGFDVHCTKPIDMNALASLMATPGPAASDESPIRSE